MNPEARIPDGTVEVTMRTGEFRLHADDCRDLLREQRHSVENVILTETTVGEYADFLFGDVASDRAAFETDEWFAAVAQEFDAQVTILPCVHLK